MNNSSMINDNFGFYADNGHFHNVNFPTGDNASPQVDQLLGVNDHGIAVGFYTNGQGSNRGYKYNIRTRPFTRVLPPGFTERHGRAEPDRRGDQQPRRRGRLLHQDLLADRRLPAAGRRPVHHACRPRRLDDPGVRHERQR